MPKITVRYNADRFRTKGLRAIYEILGLQVAKTADPSFTLREIDYYVYPNGPYSHAPLLAIEIQTIGKRDRKKRMNDAVAEWKRLVEEIPEVQLLRLPAGSALIWIQYVDKDGPHV